MVYPPSTYLVSAAVALVAVQIQQTTATSIYFDPVTTSGTTDEITDQFPGLGGDVADQDCTITVELNPTLPDIKTILNVPVTFSDLLANTSTAPTDPVYTKVGTVVMSEETPATESNQDAYIDSTMLSTPTRQQGKAVVKDKLNCATGWEETKPARKLRESNVSGHALEEKLQTKRHLEANTNKDIAKLEAYFGTKMEMTPGRPPDCGCSHSVAVSWSILAYLPGQHQCCLE